MALSFFHFGCQFWLIGSSLRLILAVYLYVAFIWFLLSSRAQRAEYCKRSISAHAQQRSLRVALRHGILCSCLIIYRGHGPDGTQIVNSNNTTGQVST